MINIKLINQESHTITALLVLCQDYVLADEEFMANDKIKRNMKDVEFWIELAHGLSGAVSEYIRVNNGEQEGYDEYESNAVSEKAILDFVLDPSNRFELNDIICDSIENWLTHFGGRR
jgi:hypothetical protein